MTYLTLHSASLSIFYIFGFREKKHMLAFKFWLKEKTNPHKYSIQYYLNALAKLYSSI